MSTPVISVEDLSKYYRLGVIGGGTLREDVNRWWARARRKRDPSSKVGEDARPQPRGGYVWALRDVNFEVNDGEILGIIGRNGAGKSTLLKILSRITAPTSGRAVIKGRIGSLLEVGTGFHPELTGRENIYLNGAILGMRRGEVARKLEEIVEFAEVASFVDTPVKRYSSGMIVRLAFAVAAHLEPEILIVDEVLAVGDVNFQKKCLGKMGEVASGGRTVLFVSHNMGTIESLCTKGLYISDGQVYCQGVVRAVVDRYLETTVTHRAQTVVDDAGHGYRIRLDNTQINIRSGEQLRLLLTASSPKELQHLSMGLLLHDSRGQPIMGASSKFQGVYGSAGTSWDAEIDFGCVPLIEGDYLATLYIGNKSRDYAKFSDVLLVRVSATDPFGYGRTLPKSWGSLYWAPTWRFVSM